MALQLVGEHRSDYFPESVKQLGQHVVWRPRLIPFLATLMWFTDRTDPPEIREEMYWRALTMHPHIPKYEAEPVARGLEKVDSDPDKDARSKVVEYVVYKVGPLSRFRARARNYACSVREGKERLVCPERNYTVDAAFLGEDAIEIHECKFNPANFLYEQGVEKALSKRARRKLQYLDKLRLLLMSQYGMTAYVYITGFNINVEHIAAVLAKHGFGAMRAKGPKDLEEAAVMRIQSQHNADSAAYMS